MAKKTTSIKQKAANKKNIVQRSKYDELLNKDGMSFIKTRFKYKFSVPQKFDVSKIILKPSIFQGRTVPYASETVDKIIREGYDITQDPIVLFKDGNENIVISGHSRFEAAQRLNKKGKLKQITVKFFNGDIDEAIDYALIESNRSGKAEGVESDIKAYKRAVDRGYNKNFLKSIFKEESYIMILKNLSCLNAKGRFVEILSKGENTEAKSFPYLLRNATWCGTLRRINPNLTNEHELEMFNFLYKSENGLKIKKQAFFDLISKKVDKFDFDPSKPLQLNKVKEFDMIKESDPGVVRYNSIRNAIRSYQDDFYKKTEFAVRASLSGDKAKEKEFTLKLNEIAQAMKNKFIELIKLESGLKKENTRLKTSGMF